jgi:hypothetical protein
MYRTKISQFPEDKFQQFAAAYPYHREMTNAKARRAFLRALGIAPYAVMLHALEQHTRSEQWQQRIVPSMVKWLEEERWLQTLPEPQPARLSVADEARRFASLSPQDQLRRLGVKR